MRKNEEDVENAERDYWNGEEINRDELLGVVFQKCAPRLRGRVWMPDHVLGNSRLGDIDSKFEQFAMNSRSSPKRQLSILGAAIITCTSSDSLHPASLAWNEALCDLMGFAGKACVSPMACKAVNSIS